MSMEPASSRAVVSEDQQVAALVAELKAEIQSGRVQTIRLANAGLIQTYWRVGKRLNEQAKAEGWGAGTIKRVAAELSASFPGEKGYSYRNLKYMRQLASTYPDAIGQQAVAQLGWGQIIDLLDKAQGAEKREWYAKQALTNGWSRKVLAFNVKNDSYARTANAITNFKEVDLAQSELLRDMVKSDYLFEHIQLAEQHSERDLEDALVEKVQTTMLELGTGFAFVGRQKHFEVGGNDYYIDLLFFNIPLNRYVVVELKIEDYKPEFMGKLNFYTQMVNAQLKLPAHENTVGLLLVTGINNEVLELSLPHASNLTAVATYQTDNSDALQTVLPSQSQLETAVREAKDAASFQE